MQTDRELRLQRRRIMSVLEDKFEALSAEHTRSKQELTDLCTLISQLQTTISSTTQATTTPKVTTFFSESFQ